MYLFNILILIRKQLINIYGTFFGILDEEVDNIGCKYNISHSYSFQIYY